jgi:hypothetical protein
MSALSPDRPKFFKTGGGEDLETYKSGIPGKATHSEQASKLI